MSYAQDLDTGEIVQLPHAEAVRWALDRLSEGHKPYLSATPIPAGHGAAYRLASASSADEWSV